MTKYIFVYGTLMKCTPPNKWSKILHNNSTFIGDAYVIGEMFNINWFPGLVAGDKKVYGEVYEIINMDIYVDLDDYEDYHADDEKNSLFVRKVTNATLVESGEELEVSVYYYNKVVNPYNKIITGKFTDFLEKVETLQKK